jgi:hypothetical protein
MDFFVDRDGLRLTRGTARMASTADEAVRMDGRQRLARTGSNEDGIVIGSGLGRGVATWRPVDVVLQSALAFVIGGKAGVRARKEPGIARTTT